LSHCVIVIPAYNEASTIRDVVTRTLQYAERVIVVDDGSTDGTAGLLASLPVSVLRNTSNSGKAASLVRGIDEALKGQCNAVITLDGDGQHRPEDIPALLAAHEESPDAIVIGARQKTRADTPADRYFANRFADFWIAWAAGQPIEDSQSGFRVYPASLLRSVRPRCDRTASFVFESEFLIEAGRRGARLIGVPIPAIYEPRGRRSHFRSVVDVARIVRMVAWKLVSRGMDLPGLVRSLRKPSADVICTYRKTEPRTRYQRTGRAYRSPIAPPDK
jgi:glycosyltransferase involved in cell wall biosynthesis